MLYPWFFLGRRRAGLAGTTNVIYVFEDYSLDTDRRELRRGTKLVAVEPQVFDLLLFLIRNRTRVVSKDDLIAEVWNGRIVSESALYSRITAVRHAIGDTGEAQRLIRTVARKGLRFVAEVREEQRAVDDSAEISAPPRDASVAPTAASSAGPERRQLTILVCSMAGSTALSARLDPEDFREVVAAYHGCVRGVADRHGGSVACRMGDRALVYFGYPEAHEDDAERAVRAGLALMRAVGKLDIDGFSERLQVRVGIATGLVVVGAGAAMEHSVVGETPLLAVHLLSLATPGAVLISGATRRLLGRLFDYRELDAAELDSDAGSAEACQVLGEGTVVSRFEALRSPPIPLIGREEELDLLARRWQQAKRGEGRVVLVTGEPGIGKSRLIHALQERLESEAGKARLAWFCSPNHKDTALHPISAELFRSAGIEPDDTARVRLDKLEVLFQPSSENLAKDIPLFAALLSIPGGERFGLPKLTPQQ